MKSSSSRYNIEMIMKKFVHLLFAWHILYNDWCGHFDWQRETVCQIRLIWVRLRVNYVLSRCDAHARSRVNISCYRMMDFIFHYLIRSPYYSSWCCLYRFEQCVDCNRAMICNHFIFIYCEGILWSTFSFTFISAVYVCYGHG